MTIDCILYMYIYRCLFYIYILPPLPILFWLSTYFRLLCFSIETSPGNSNFLVLKLLCLNLCDFTNSNESIGYNIVKIKWMTENTIIVICNVLFLEELGVNDTWPTLW